MTKPTLRLLPLAFALLLLLAAAPVRADEASAAPFRAGEIVVAGTPESLPAGLTAIKYLARANLTVAAVPPGSERALAARLMAQGRRAGVNRLAFATADDPFLFLQWHFTQVQAPAAWTLGAGGGVIVAVLDTGLAPGGPDGIGCVLPGWDAVNGDDDPYDGDGHGTHVSGTIAQRTGNGVGVAGLAHGACILPVKVLDDGGSGSFADIAEGVYYAVDEGAQVINLSLGTNARYALAHDPFMDPALDYAYAAGVTVVAASGNDGSRKNVSYPAIYPTTIAVGATDFLEAVTRYSNKGAGLDLVAPGGDAADKNGDGYIDGVLQETFYNGGWNYYFFTGTSMATPHVAAAAAMLIANGTAATPEEILTALTSTAKDIGDPGVDSASGHGLLQVYDALLWEPEVVVPRIDADGDGFTVEEGDCDDTDPNVYPGHTDTKAKWGRDGVDNDCNGIIDG